MAMELQSHMISWIRPSILAAVTQESGDVDHATLAQWYADAHWAGDDTAKYDRILAVAQATPIEGLVEGLVAKVVKLGAETCNFDGFYLDSWTTIDWCDEDTMLAYYG